MTITQSTTQKIVDEQGAITRAEAARAKLTATRTAALKAGDNPAIDRVEAELRTADTAIARSNERIELLKQEQQEEIAASASAELDALATSADRMRALGENIISKYAAHALAISNMLTHLQIADDFIFEANRKLSRAGRPVISSPNRVRCRSPETVTRIQRLRLGVGDKRHPQYGKVQIDLNGNAVDLMTGDRVPKFGESDVEVTESKIGVFPDPLQKTVRLPADGADACDFWPSRRPSVGSSLPTIADLIEKPSVVAEHLSKFSSLAA